MNNTLKVLSINDNYLGEKGALALADALAHNTSIEELHVKGNELGDAGVRAICESLQVRACSACLFVLVPSPRGWGRETGEGGGRMQASTSTCSSRFYRTASLQVWCCCRCGASLIWLTLGGMGTHDRPRLLLSDSTQRTSRVGAQASVA